MRHQTMMDESALWASQSRYALLDLSKNPVSERSNFISLDEFQSQGQITKRERWHPQSAPAQLERYDLYPNGNVRIWEDVETNRAYTGADGIMVGETLLANPCLFANVVPDPVKISLEYLDLCRALPSTVILQAMQTHVRHFVDHQCGRRPWFNKFRTALNRSQSVDDIERLLRVKVQ
ncbi:hypothetical protein BKA93DRAFT_827196 [Sparassis latifolia]